MNLSHIPQVVSTRPMVLLTGFLGAGKTTLLRELLVAAQHAELITHVILNDYADAQLDSATLEDFTRSIEPLTAACACCDGLDFLLELSMKSAKDTSDILFVELNGTADPVPIIESFTLLENKLLLHPRWQICVIDTRHFGTRGTYSDIETLQLQTASHIYLSHIDKSIPTDLIIDNIKKINPHASIVSKKEIIKMVISLGKTKKQLLMAQQSGKEANDLNLIKKSEHHHKTHEFTSCQILLPVEVPEDAIRDWLASLPSGVIRAKALVAIYEDPNSRYLFERVGSEVEKDAQKVDLGKNVPNSAILIGPDLDIEELQKLTIKHLNNTYS